MSRQVWIFVALAMVALTSLLASIEAWMLLWRDRKSRIDAGAREGLAEGAREGLAEGARAEHATGAHEGSPPARN